MTSWQTWYLVRATLFCWMFSVLIRSFELPLKVSFVIYGFGLVGYFWSNPLNRQKVIRMYRDPSNGFVLMPQGTRVIYDGVEYETTEATRVPPGKGVVEIPIDRVK